MAPPTKIEIGELDADAYLDLDKTGWALLAGNELAVPSRIAVAARLIEPACDVHLDLFVENGSPLVHGVTIERVLATPGPWGDPITGSVMRRVALDHLIRAAIEKVAKPVVRRDDVEGYEGRVAYQLQEDFDAGRKDVVWVGPPGRPLTGPGRRTSNEVLLRVAAVYRGAHRAPTQAVADQLHVSRSHAGRLVQLAREAGHLGARRPVEAKDRDGG
jgi:hypothetical protein